MKEKKSLLRNDGFQTLLSSLACILGGLIVGFEGGFNTRNSNLEF